MLLRDRTALEDQARARSPEDLDQWKNWTSQGRISQYGWYDDSIFGQYPPFTLQERHSFTDSLEWIANNRAANLSEGLKKKIGELSKLKVNWNDEGAKSIKRGVLADAIELLARLQQRPDFREPFIVPTFEGSVQFEWHEEGRSLEFEAVPQGWSIVGTSACDDAQYNVAECGRSDFVFLAECYDWLVGGVLIWPST